jgi:SAM-dependent methyltransferase
MYKTRVTGGSTAGGPDYFDWNAYFNRRMSAAGEDIENLDSQVLAEQVQRMRAHLKEDFNRMGFVFSRLMRGLLKGLDLPANPRILELGAATGYLSRWLLTRFGGTAVLVDNGETSYNAFHAMPHNLEDHIVYRREDLFELDLEPRFNLVGSFGLIEHFSDKKEVLKVHTRFLAPGGYVIILVPADTTLTRVFLEAYPELNQGYRELLSQSEFRQLLVDHHLKPIRVLSGNGYVYDFCAALCRP